MDDLVKRRADRLAILYADKTGFTQVGDEIEREDPAMRNARFMAYRAGWEDGYEFYRSIISLTTGEGK